MKAEFNLTRTQDTGILRVKGELTASAAGQFKGHLQDIAEMTDLVISLAEVTMMDVSAIQLVQSFSTSFRNRGRIHVELPTNIELVYLLERTGLLQVLSINK